MDRYKRTGLRRSGKYREGVGQCQLQAPAPGANPVQGEREGEARSSCFDDMQARPVNRCQKRTEMANVLELTVFTTSCGFNMFFRD